MRNYKTSVPIIDLILSGESIEGLAVVDDLHEELEVLTGAYISSKRGFECFCESGNSLEATTIHKLVSVVTVSDVLGAMDQIRLLWMSGAHGAAQGMLEKHIYDMGEILSTTTAPAPAAPTCAD